MNENMKERFCEDYLRSRIIQKTSLYGLFRKIELYEEDLAKDVSEFTREDVVDYYIDDERVTINGNLMCIDVMITE